MSDVENPDHTQTRWAQFGDRAVIVKGLYKGIMGDIIGIWRDGEMMLYRISTPDGEGRTFERKDFIVYE